MSQLPVADALIIILFQSPEAINIRKTTLKMRVNCQFGKNRSNIKPGAETDLGGALRSELSSFSAHQISSALSLCL